jgi:Ca-activated chloride channel family protein
MKFLSPGLLWLLLGVPALVGAYVLLLRRRNKAAVRYASVSLVAQALGPGQRLRRHVPPLLFLLALAALLVAIARPTAVVTLPTEQQTIILAMDVSGSMRATDVEPDRITASQTAAKAFVDQQPPRVRIGIVTFAGTASVVQTPTDDRDALKAAIDRFQLQRHTAIGSGIIMSLATIFPEEGIDLEAAIFGAGFSRQSGANATLEKAGKQAPKKPFKPVAPGSYSSAVIILLTDGRRTTGPDALEAAKMAADRGVRIYTVGFGSADGSSVAGGFEGWSIYMRFDEELLKQVAQLTGAEYFHARSAADLIKVYEGLNARYVLEKKATEVSALFTAFAAVLALVAAALSVRWFNRMA